MRFIADSMLGGLAKYLRMLGFSTEYSNKSDDRDLLRALEEDQKAILLTKDRHLKNENHKYRNRIFLVLSDDKVEQTVEVLKSFNLKDKISPFVRCLECNAEIQRVGKEEVKGLIPRDTYEVFEEFYRCPGCNKIYWFSTHTQRMEIIINRIMRELEEE